MFQSIPLWLQYLEFVEERDTSVADCTEPGIAKMRALFERALTSTGLHFTEGGKVWEAYRDYESALLLSMAEASPEVLQDLFLLRTTFLILKHVDLNCRVIGLFYIFIFYIFIFLMLGSKVARTAYCVKYVHDGRLLCSSMTHVCSLFCYFDYFSRDLARQKASRLRS